MNATLQNRPINGYLVVNGTGDLVNVFDSFPESHDFNLAPLVLQALQKALSHLTPNVFDPFSPEHLSARIRDCFLHLRGRRDLIALTNGLFPACDSLVRQLENPNWRVREAACAALNACYPHTSTRIKKLRC